MINILYEDNHLLVVEKPVNIPVQEDESKDEDLLSILKQYIKEKYQKPGDVFLGLVHRLDRPVGGVMVFARTSKAASRLSQQIQKQTFEKTYLAVLCGESRKQETLVDYLIKDSRKNIVKVTSSTNPSGKRAELSYQLISKTKGLSFVEIELKTGRSHQIRVQFASRSMPLWGDQRYNQEAIVGQQIALWANKLSILHPITQEKMTFISEVPNTYPWTQFRRN